MLLGLVWSCVEPHSVLGVVGGGGSGDGVWDGFSEGVVEEGVGAGYEGHECGIVGGAEVLVVGGEWALLCFDGDWHVVYFLIINFFPEGLTWVLPLYLSDGVVEKMAEFFLDCGDFFNVTWAC